MILTKWDSGKRKNMETVKRSVVRNERDERMKHRGFSTAVKILCDTIVVISCHYSFVKTHRMYNTRNEP